MRAVGNPLLLLHGIHDTVKLFNRLCVYLREHPGVHCLDLVANNGDAGLETLAAQVASYITNRVPDSEKLDIVGFSMGGLVARYYVQRLDGLSRVQRLITISTPHHGTRMAYLGRNLGARQMRPASDFLKDLNRDAAVLNQIQFTSIWTPLDLMVIPASSSVMPEARSISIRVLAHPLMLRDQRVLRMVEQALYA